jgi:hypothetical protein
MRDDERRRQYETAFVALLLRFGAREPGLREDVAQTVTESLLALADCTNDGTSLSGLDVLRIRAGKFAAARLPAALYRDRAQLAALRREILRLAEAWLGPDHGDSPARD